MRLTMFIAALLPALIILLYFREREGYATPAQAIWEAFAIGALMAFPVVTVVGLGVKPFVSLDGLHAKSLAEAFLEAAIPEECFKLLAVILIFGRHSDIRHVHQSLVIAVAVATGFAALENMFYLSESENWSLTAAFRSITAVPSHAFTGAIMGAFLALARERKSKALCVATLAGPILLHGLYDYFLFVADKIDFGAEHRSTLATVSIGGFAFVVFCEGALAIWMSRRLLDHQPFARYYTNEASRVTYLWIESTALRAATWTVIGVVLIAGGGAFLIGSALIATGLWAGPENIANKLPVVYATAYLAAFGAFGLFHGWAFWTIARRLKYLGRAA